MFKRIILYAALSVGLILAGCAAGVAAPQSPQQIVFTAKSSYDAALTAAVAYKRLPLCSATVKQPCSSASVVAQLQKADTTASAALDAAETAVRTPGFGKDVVSSATAAASAALNAFVAITATLGAK